MAKHDNGFPFDDEDLITLETEMRKYKVPLIYKWVFGSLYKYGRIFMPTLFFIIVAMGIIHVTNTMDLWYVLKGFILFWIFFIGGLTAIAWLAHRIKVMRWCKRLDITINQWNMLAIMFRITYI